jgi:hypothetical protein
MRPYALGTCTEHVTSGEDTRDVTQPYLQIPYLYQPLNILLLLTSPSSKYSTSTNLTLKLLPLPANPLRCLL